MFLFTFLHGFDGANLLVQACCIPHLVHTLEGMVAAFDSTRHHLPCGRSKRVVEEGLEYYWHLTYRHCTILYIKQHIYACVGEI